MTFEIRKGNTVMFRTTYKECIPSPDTLRNMKANGYVPYLDGKILRMGKGDVYGKTC